MLRPDRRVSCLTYCLMETMDLSGTLRLTTPLLAIRQLKSWNLRPKALAAALLTSLTDRDRWEQQHGRRTHAAKRGL